MNDEASSSQPSRTPAPAPQGRRSRAWRTAGATACALTGLLAVAIAAGEACGWPWLVAPAERWLSQGLQQTVQLQAPDGEGLAPGERARLRLLGGVQLRTGQLAVLWTDNGRQTPWLQARQLLLSARWTDLLRWRQGQPLPLDTVSANRLDLHLHRGADGRGNWQGPTAAGPDRGPDSLGTGLPVRVRKLALAQGTLRWVDAPMALDLTAHLDLRDLPQRADGPPEPNALRRAGVQLRAEGRLQGRPLKATLATGAIAPWWDGSGQAVPLTARVSANGAELRFDGSAQNPADEAGLQGRFRLSGPSLAAVGQALGLTLPSTAAFSLQGGLQRSGAVWHAVVDDALIGQSRLAGAFRYDTAPARPLLAGRLNGRSLRLQDLGPALGAAPAGQASPVRAPGRVLPDRRLDIPSLRTMDANVLLRIDRLDFGTDELASAAPLNGHLSLVGGVLSLQDLDLGLAQGRVRGRVLLDGRDDAARWQADLRADGMRLEKWVGALNRPGSVPYASGRLAARLELQGTGRSTAQMLASAQGRMALRWTEGTLSHLVVEAAGLDLAQSLGVLLRGDDSLRVNCGLADFRVRQGVAVPTVFVVDTRDSSLWLGGDVSLATERLNLTLTVRPKDFSPLAARSPIEVRGLLGAPQVRLQAAPLAARGLLAAAAATLNPLAALLPFLDPGEDDGPDAAGCQVGAR